MEGKTKDYLQKYDQPKNFFNRELSWIAFNNRVLEEACNPGNPLLERVKFLSIFHSNLDEFYMIRISGIKEQIEANVAEVRIDGLTPQKELEKIEDVLEPILEKIVDYWHNSLVPELRENNIDITHYSGLEHREKEILNHYFEKYLFPNLTPLAIDPGRPFPFIRNLALSIGIIIKNPKGELHFARVKVPDNIPRLIRIDTLLNESRKTYKGNGYIKVIWVEDLIIANLKRLFPGMKIVEAKTFRITRDTDIEIQEDEADDLLKVIEENIKQRRFGNVVRMEIEEGVSDSLLDVLSTHLELDEHDIHRVKAPIGLSKVIELYGLPFHHLKDKPFIHKVPKIFEEEGDIFSAIRQRDIFLHHPYHSFSPVIDFIRQAAEDPDVLTIKQTLYRVGTNSPIIKHLMDAADSKKQVAVLVELKARFDEENNIFWARALEKVGAHVVYGLIGLKTHGKMTLVVRREGSELRRYVHLSTGNYNSSTAKMYTDFGLFTCNDDICSDVSDIFNFLTGYSNQKEFKKLLVAPVNMRQRLVHLIEREIANARAGKKGRIILKTNSVVDPQIISVLYEASCAGVEIDLIVRGICALVPGKKGLSENIRVRSIVGRFLEHHRVFYFYNNGAEDVFISSADLMQRNLSGRVEVATPILSPEIKNYLIKNVLNLALADNVTARILDENMNYFFRPVIDGEEKINYQQKLIELH